MGGAPHRFSEIRSWTGQVLHTLNPPHLDDAVLVVIELVSNAYEHGGGALHLTLSASTPPCAVAVEVDDVTMVEPVPGRSRLSVLRGRGLVLVEALSVDWGVRYSPRSDGKTVWAEVRCDGPDQTRCTDSR